MNNSKRNRTDYILLLITIAVSGFPYFSTTDLYIPLVIILFLVFKIRKRKFDSKFLFLLLFLFVITVIQTYIFNFYSIPTIIGVFLRVILGYLIVKILKEKYILYYTNILYYLALISLIIHIPVILVPQVKQILLQLVPFFQLIKFSNSEAQTIIVYNFHYLHLNAFRNSGPFWEPGAFAGYLILAFIFNLIQKTPKQKKVGIVLLIAIFTTLSTTAFLALFIFLFFIYQEKIKNLILKGLLLIIILWLGYYIFFSLDFIGEKIIYQLSQAKGVNPYVENTNSQRFLNILRDVIDFNGHELFGRGSHPTTRYSFKLKDQLRTVGLTDILVRMGILFFGYMMFLLFRSIRSIVSYFSYGKPEIYIGAFLTIIILLMSEVYFNFPIFWSLLFLKFVYLKPRNKSIKFISQTIN